MSLRVRTPAGVDRWDSAHDDRSWYDYTHAVDEGELVIFLHRFRRFRDRVDRESDRLGWKHHTTKAVRRYAVGEWEKVTRVRRQTPPTSFEVVPHVPREPREPRRR